MPEPRKWDSIHRIGGAGERKREESKDPGDIPSFLSRSRTRMLEQRATYSIKPWSKITHTPAYGRSVETGGVTVMTNDHLWVDV